MYNCVFGMSYVDCWNDPKQLVYNKCDPSSVQEQNICHKSTTNFPTNEITEKY